ncbi:uncharacterized protein LOC122133424 [Clupea harengus]|uniref:Uncharacterized protein LOC122133424 n=1 Tax=Clupea harengus TaxID=7950 RepID=A0A8M1KVE3_CLUHA|nr:uncharacterized protein LOC122133424 [Clupea harengus]
MKELPLSLLSRGCGQLVPLTEGGHDGRLEVCFEPEDFFSWRAQPLLLHLSRSGRLLGGVGDPTPPKTYSTRKGHLILYSEDLVSSSSQSVANRKGRGSKQEAEVQLHTLRDLTGAILSYRSKQQPKEGSTTGPAHPLLSHLTHASHTHLSSVRRPPLDRLAQLTERFDEGYSSGQQPPTPAPPPQVPYRPLFLCSPRPSHAPREPLPPITEGLLSQRGDGGGYLQKGRQTATHHHHSTPSKCSFPSILLTSLLSL